MTPTLPHDLDAERAVLGSVLLRPSMFADVRAAVSPAAFYHPAHAALFGAMCALDADSAPIDPLTLARRMEADGESGKLRALHGEAYLGELMAAVVVADTAPHHAGRVRDLATLRALVECGQSIAARAYEGEDASKALAFAETAVMAIGQARQAACSGPMSVRDVVRETADIVERRYEHRGKAIGIPTGLRGLDLVTQGYQPAELFILAGRPSMGKSALAMNSVTRSAVDHAIPCLVFSLEMSRTSLVERAIAGEGAIDSMRIRSGDMEGPHWLRFQRAGAIIGQAPIWIDHTGGISLADLRSRARRWRINPRHGGQHRHALVVVDYLQLVEGQDKGQSREQFVSSVSRGLKALAKELDAAVLALSQLSRKCEERGDKRPQLSDLRDSGAIEQDADTIGFLYRECVYDEKADETGAELNIAKQRNGPTLRVPLRFRREFTRFEDAT